MNTAPWRVLATGFLGVIFCSVLTGCQYAYDFDVSGVVKSATTGQPLEGVKIFSTHPVQPPTTRVNIDQLPPGEEKPVAITNADGTFSFKAHILDVYFLNGEARWVLPCSRTGFRQEDVDLRKLRLPDSPKTRVPVFLVVYMTEERGKEEVVPR